jgi:hypothetical protein
VGADDHVQARTGQGVTLEALGDGGNSFCGVRSRPHRVRARQRRGIEKSFETSKKLASL